MRRRKTTTEIHFDTVRRQERRRRKHYQTNTFVLSLWILFFSVAFYQSLIEIGKRQHIAIFWWYYEMKIRPSMYFFAHRFYDCDLVERSFFMRVRCRWRTVASLLNSWWDAIASISSRRNTKRKNGAVERTEVFSLYRRSHK